jgi:transposase-like protein
MQKICGRFERWRSSHQGRLPIPKALWASAAEVAREHGVFRTATILRLEYAKLKRMTKSAAPVKRRTASPAEFLELVAPQVAPAGPGLTECVIELEGPRGKMRVQWKGAAAPDLAGLSRGLWESA